jgi:chemotaxis protein MotB
MARKKKKHEEEENLERWLVSYADFITLLFAFFVTMYAISRVDEAKLGSAVESLQRALGSLIPVHISQRDAGAFPHKSPGATVSVISAEAEEKIPSEIKDFERLAEDIKRQVEEAKGAIDKSRSNQLDQIKFLIDRRGLVIRVPESFFFNSGQASLRPEVIPILKVLGRSLEKVSNHIRIEGHTDSVPINTPQFPSNWELSSARATTIIRYLLSNYHFSPDRLSATGYAEFRPIAPNTTPEGRSQNRRVDVVILSTKAGEAEPQEANNLNQRIPHEFPRRSDLKNRTEKVVSPAQEEKEKEAPYGVRIFREMNNPKP